MEFMTVKEINEKLILLVRTERKLSQEILNHIILFQKCGGHIKLGYSSMHQYLTRALGYSDDQAYRRLKAAQLMVALPEVGPKLESGQLNLTQAANTQKAFEMAQKEQKTLISNEKKKEIIAAIEKANNHQTKSILASELNLKPELGERVKPQSNQTVRLELNLTHEQFEKLQKVKGLLSHQIPDQNMGAILEKLFDLYLNKKMGVKSETKEESASRPFEKTDQADLAKFSNKMKLQDPEKVSSEALKRKSKNNLELEPQEINPQVTSNQKTILDKTLTEKDQELTQRLLVIKEKNINEPNEMKHFSGKESVKRNRYISALSKKALYQRSQGYCEHISKEGVQCKSRYQVQIDHQHPFSQGGESSLENLRMYCRQHNALAATAQGIGWETIIKS